MTRVIVAAEPISDIDTTAAEAVIMPLASIHGPASKLVVCCSTYVAPTSPSQRLLTLPSLSIVNGRIARVEAKGLATVKYCEPGE